VLALEGKFEEADRYADLARELSDDDDLEAQISWRTAKAKVLAHDGRHDEAVAMAEEAASLAAEGEDLEVKADALTELGRVYSLTGRHESSGPPLREALDLYEQKGDRTGVGLVRDLLESLAAA
jgi:tetratricopeptide (TPR) repeat protein